jgi:hypothetical protein
MKGMWNSKKCAAMAIVGAGLAVAAATPALAWWPGYGGYSGAAYGYGGGCGAYGAAYGGPGIGGYAGVYSYGWPYGTYGYYGGTYGAAYGGYGAAYSAAYDGYGAYGWAPAYGYAGYGYGCRKGAHRVRGYGYAVASRQLRPAYSVGYAAAKHPVQFGTALHVRNVKLARAD